MHLMHASHPEIASAGVAENLSNWPWLNRLVHTSFSTVDSDCDAFVPNCNSKLRHQKMLKLFSLGNKINRKKISWSTEIYIDIFDIYN